MRGTERSLALARCDATQITNLQYGRVQLCATLNTYSPPGYHVVGFQSEWTTDNREKWRSEASHLGFLWSHIETTT